MRLQVDKKYHLKEYLSIEVADLRESTFQAIEFLLKNIEHKDL